VALKKPSDLFDKTAEENNIQIVESDNTLREELVKVENLSEQVIQLQQELSQKVIKSDLESLVLSQINTMQENFDYLQNDFRKSNKKDIVEFKERVSELTEIVGNLVENELPKYRKQVTKNEVAIDEKFNEFIIGIRNEIDTKVNDIAEVIDTNLEYFNTQLQETSSESKNTSDTYNKLSKILESKVSKENERNDIYINEKINKLKGNVEEHIDGIEKEVTVKIDGIKEVVDTNLESFNTQLQETSSEVKKTTDTYNKLSKILENKVSKENDKLEEYSQIIESLHKSFVELEESLQEKTSTYNQIIEEKIETISSDVKNKINSIDENVTNRIDSIDEEVNTIKDKVSSEISNIKSDVVINEQHIKNVDKYLQNHHKELVKLKEEVFGEIEQIPVGNIQENLERLEKKIDYIKETYSKIKPETIVREVIKEGLLNEPPDTKNSDPLTPLDQKFVTLDQLQEHYRLFINRIQQQLSTLGGGGETQLRYLDDIVGIATNSIAYDGKYLQWNSTTNKAEFVSVSGGGGSIATYATSAGIATYATSSGIATIAGYATSSGISTVAQGLTGTPNISVGFVTASQLQVNDGGNFTGIVTASSFSGNASSATYATSAGIATYATSSGIATYATKAGVSTSVIGGIGSITQLNVSGNLGIGTVGINSIFSTTDIQSWYYTNKSKSVTTDDGTPTAVYVGASGTAMFIVGDGNNRIIQYTLSTPYDVSTAGVAVTFFSTALQDTNPSGIDFNTTGTKMFVSGQTALAPLIVGGEYVHEYSLSTAWSVDPTSVGWTTSYNVTEDTLPAGVIFGNSGSKMYVVGNTGDAVYQYSLSTPYSLASGVTYDNISLVLGTNPILLEINPNDISFNSTGTVLWIVGNTNDRIYEFRLGTAWDISTAVFYDDVYIGFNELVVTGLHVIPGQNIAYIVGSTSDTVFQYSTNTPALEIASSGISSVSSIVLNNETRVKDKLYVKGLAHFDGNIVTQGTLTVDSATTISAGSLTVTSGTFTAGNNSAGLLGGNTTTTIAFASGQTTGTLTIGGASQTGIMSVGVSTASQTTNIQAGANASATTKTINLGTGGLSGSITQINIGPTAGIGTVVINTGTNVGIGTTVLTGTASQPLQVTGGAYVSGNIGIGRTNPSYKLETLGTIAGYSPDTTSVATLAISNVGVCDLTAYKVTGGTLTFKVADTGGVNQERVRIISSGNVGIATTNPTSTLTVAGTALITGITTVGLGTTSTPPSNSQMSFELITDTNLRIKVRGTDGVLRSANITLA
jgi:hypothetical protein